MLSLRAGLALCKLLGIKDEGIVSLSIEADISGGCFIALTRRLSEEEVKRLEIFAGVSNK